MQGSLASYLAQITAAGQHLADAAATRGGLRPCLPERQGAARRTYGTSAA